MTTGDPRHFQIAALLGLAAYGTSRLGFDVTPQAAAVALGSCLATQAVGDWRSGRPFEPRSALISGLSLCLLFRASSPWLVAAAGVATIGSKFVLRFRGKHVFNPTNFGVVALVLATGQAWISPGQWGNAAWFGFLMACLGTVVVTRAARADVTFAYLLAHAAGLFGRALYLGDPLEIPVHQMQNGALLLFAFFMISDPKTTPDSRAGRLVFAALVAAGAWYVQFRLFRSGGPLYALFVFSPLVPLLDRLLPGPRYAWEKGEARHAPSLAPAPAAPRAAAV